MAVDGILSKIYSGLSEVRNFFYDTGLLDVVEVGPPVISVGNLSMGGTGKTPVVDFLLRELKGRGLRPLVVSRNYKALTKIMEPVVLEKVNAAKWFGDEPTMIKTWHPEVPVYVGPVKALTAQFALKQEENIDVVIVDDGFQHRGLNRRFDIVLLDASVPANRYQVVPAGELREGFSALHRAEQVIITKANLASQEHLQWLRTQIPSHCQISEMKFETKLSQELGPGQRLAVVAGIGKPKIFFDQVREIAKAHGAEVVFAKEFSDHANYSSEDVRVIESEMSRQGATHLVMTEKDFIKIQNVNIAVPIVVARLEVGWVVEPDSQRGLYGFLDQLARS